jgi:hypothetical protein
MCFESTKAVCRAVQGIIKTLRMAVRIPATSRAESKSGLAQARSFGKWRVLQRSERALGSNPTPGFIGE